MTAAARRSRLLAATLAACLGALTLLVYWPVRDHQFIGYDDIPYVTGNVMVQQGPTAASLRWAFAGFAWGNWHPLTWISHMLDVRLFGDWAGGHHLTSLALHTASTLLLFAALVAMTSAPWRSAAVSALFAVHPLHVESVAWVAERKDVLSGFFWMLALVAYVRYARRPGVPKGLAVAACFAAGLSAKPMAITLPFVLLLLDAWPLGRLSSRPGGRTFASLLREKAPLLALSAASAVVTLLAQRSGEAIRSWEQYPLGLRVANALVSYVRYLAMTLRPTDLIVFHPYAPVSAGEAWRAAAVLAALSVLVARAARARPYLLTGWLWYLGTLVPVIGIVQVGGQALADRYTYLPLVGVFIAAVWGGAGLLGARRTRTAVAGAAACALLGALAFMAREQLRFWRDDTSMYRHILAVDPGNYLALNNLGARLMKEGKTREAGALLSQAYRNNPRLLSALHITTANRLLEEGRREEAIRHLKQAAQAEPGSPVIREALRTAFGSQVEEIRAPFRPMIAAGGPTAAAGWYQQGVSLGREGLLEEALASLQEAVRLRPSFPEAHCALGVTYTNLGRYREAVRAFEEALRIRPGMPDATDALEKVRPLLQR